MSAPESFYTLSSSACAEFTERKSRFIGYASPAVSEEAALRCIQSVRDAHKTASHHCYAYIIGFNAGVMRYQDDGEPQGTAGIPILEVIKKNSLVNCCAVVTRYFGGVLLGTGGLARAYSRACAMAVQKAGIAAAESSVYLTVRISYSVWDKLNYALEKLPVVVVDRTFESCVVLKIAVREKDKGLIEDLLAAHTDGTADVQASAPFIMNWPIGDDLLFHG